MGDKEVEEYTRLRQEVGLYLVNEKKYKIYENGIPDGFPFDFLNFSLHYDKWGENYCLGKMHCLASDRFQEWVLIVPEKSGLYDENIKNARKLRDELKKEFDLIVYMVPSIYGTDIKMFSDL